MNEFVFRLTNYDDSLREQVARALNKKGEMISREKLPGLWSIVDMLNRHRADENTLKKRRIRYKIYGVFLLLMGLFLLIPGLMKPQELMMPLLIGAIGVIVGISYIKPRKTAPSKKIYKAADELIGKLSALDVDGTEVRFTDDGMVIGDSDAIKYSRFNGIFECEDIYMLTWDEKVTILKKCDLVAGDGFTAFLKGKTKLDIIGLN